MSAISVVGVYPRNSEVSPEEYGFLVDGPFWLELVPSSQGDTISGTVKYMGKDGEELGWIALPDNGNEVISGRMLRWYNAFRGMRVVIDVESISGTWYFNKYLR